MHMYELNDKVYDLLEKKICEVVEKGDISPTEMECVEKAYKTLEAITTIEAMLEYGEEDGYSMKRRGGSRVSHRGGYPDEYVLDRGYPVSYKRDGRMRRGESYHSVNDRIVANLEAELNSDISDFERQRIMDEIRRIKEMKD